ncbi:MAG: 2-oxoacid:ferredoxin oxidoreductase subunit beta [Tissierellales bacterium]|nr:2-oxoacid:ferredoxin oxidoreductase subunit beta [Tissierellales bacterium]MBN2826906.1 2-oxoacid:ferredoxin oxidoreductase subunit beta [Tissierellales bacterium]
MQSELVQKYLREDRLPHIWCPGCGHGVIMHAVIRAIDNLKLDPEKVCIVSGIGCSSRASGYMNFNTLHTTHGRALAFATGVKMSQPDLHVIVLTGDGDTSAIGGNHLIHAARRNIDITTITFNNNIYGMTGGQYSPTTPYMDFGTTAPYGNIDNSFDLCDLAKGAGASYVGRATAYHAVQLAKIIESAISNKGFSFVEAVSSCPTYYGRKNKKGDAVNMMKTLKDMYVDIKIAEKKPELADGKIIFGELYNNPQDEYTDKYQKIIDMLKKEN